LTTPFFGTISLLIHRLLQARDVPGMSGYYVAYEAIKRAWKPWGKDGAPPFTFENTS
jgi:hypothetical protein